MKKITLLFITMLALSISAYSQSCTYTLEMNDNGFGIGDGWQNGTVDVLLDGVVVLDEATFTSGAQATLTFSVTEGTGVGITTQWSNPDDWPSEISYRILDALGNEVGAGTPTSDITIPIAVDCPPCDIPAVSYEIVTNCPANNNFSINVIVSYIGAASGVIITDDQSTAASGVLGVGTHNYGSYLNGTSVIITVTNNDNAICVINSSSLLFANACPPSNDSCATPLVLTAYNFGSEVWGISTTLGTTASGEVDENDISCANAFSLGAGRDVWFRVKVPAAGEITITTREVLGSNLDDTIMAVFSGGCGSLVEVTNGCNDDIDAGGGNYMSEVSLTGVDGIAADDILWVRIHEYSNSASDGADDGEFEIVAHATDATLSNETFEQDITALSYFPNPVTNKLTLKAQQNIQNVSVYNMLGQEVMRTEMNLQRGELDMSSLQSGPYFVKVSINGTVETIKIIKK
jgi:hypothetical protein